MDVLNNPRWPFPVAHPIPNERFTLHHGDCLAVMRGMADGSVDSIVTDPPYGIRFMGKAWDGADIEARAGVRRRAASHAPDSGPNGGHKSIAAEAGKYDLAPAAMRAFQEFSEEWAREAFRVLKPGGHLLAFSSPRTYHRMACGIEDAGFELRDQIMWVFGSGFPKSMNVANAIHDAAIGQPQGGKKPSSANHGKFKGGCSDENKSGKGFGAGPGQFMAEAGGKTDRVLVDAARQWDGWGTALKPAHEPICVARKPFTGTVAANVLVHGTGAINIEACRVGGGVRFNAPAGNVAGGNVLNMSAQGVPQDAEGTTAAGRWPANLIHDGSDEVLDAFPDAPVQQADASATAPSAKTSGIYGPMKRLGEASQDSENDGAVGFKMKPGARRLDAGSAARFFYCAKANKKDRGDGNTHPTVKPTDLMAYLCRLVTPPGGLVLDPFLGSGSTGKAAMREGFRFIGIELDRDYLAIANGRIRYEMEL